MTLLYQLPALPIKDYFLPPIKYTVYLNNYSQIDLLFPHISQKYLKTQTNQKQNGKRLEIFYKNCCQPTTSESGELGPHGVTAQNVGVSALARDLLHFEATHQVPDGLSKHVASSRKAQANWFKKLIPAWKGSKPPPKTPEEAARLIIQTLKRNQEADVEGLLAFYGLPLPHTLVEISSEVPSYLPEGVKYELHTLPVDGRAVADGDTVTVYVSTKDSRESSSVPREIQIAAVERAKARAVRDYVKADALHQMIIDQNYRVINVQNEDVLAQKYRIRLRGIDAPEGAMPYGKQATEELTNLLQGKCLRVLVYGNDQYGRFVGDIYCNGIFAHVLFSSGHIYLKEVMLKKGLAWHYAAYDRRPQLAIWEKEARAKRVGLWASRNPEEPWEWRKNNKRNAN